jgi:hypothetical protein
VVVWQAAFGELFLNQDTKDGLVHDGLAAFTDSTARFTGVSAPGGANPKGRGAGEGTVRLPPLRRLVDFGPPSPPGVE